MRILTTEIGMERVVLEKLQQPLIMVFAFQALLLMLKLEVNFHKNS